MQKAFFSCTVIMQNAFFSCAVIMQIAKPTAGESWSEWSSYGSCSTTCGEGLIVRNRTCLSKTCVGHSIEAKDCIIKQCASGEFQIQSCACYNDLSGHCWQSVHFWQRGGNEG